MARLFGVLRAERMSKMSKNHRRDIEPPPPCGEVEICEANFGWGDSCRGTGPHPKSLTRFRPPRKGEVIHLPTKVADAISISDRVGDRLSLQGGGGAGAWT